MTVRFNLDIDVEAEKWDNEQMKENFIRNFTDVVQRGLARMTVPDWTVRNVTVEFIEDSDVE